ncbi:MAG: hypothetical protein NZ902_01535 [Acidilobaceae archaeon]|nr:hypothetical protein [Acidilobaceae archaeon]MCX8165506.1 hypothetical protein [Acidilobaceae archaeon]MDW7973933.1 hypothetical protein [Sulfolobales archaeon]
MRRQGAKEIYIVLLIYAILASFLLLIAYPVPNYSGILVPEGELVYLSGDAVAAVRLDGRTMVVKEGISLNATGKACASGDQVYILSADKVTYVSLTARDARSFQLPYLLSGADLQCSSSTFFVSGIAGKSLKILKVDARSGQGEMISAPLYSTETKIGWEGEKIYVALDRSLLEVSKEDASLYELIPDMKPSGITFYKGSPVVFGKRGTAALIYWLGGAKAIEIEVAGRESSVDALLCENYWCRALVVPFGDWLRVVEFREWRHVRDVKIVGTRGFVYSGAGVSDSIWFSGKLVGTGSIAVAIRSTSKAVIGTGREGYFMVEEGLPRPRLYEYRVPPIKRTLEVEREHISLREEKVQGERVTVSYQRVGSLRDLIRGVFTAIALLGPPAAYLLRRFCC